MSVARNVVDNVGDNVGDCVGDSVVDVARNVVKDVAKVVNDKSYNPKILKHRLFESLFCARIMRVRYFSTFLEFTM